VASARMVSRRTVSFGRDFFILARYRKSCVQRIATSPASPR
jgi:hypothetical protein